MRKFLLSMMAVMTVILLAACGGNGDNAAEEETNNEDKASNDHSGDDALQVLTSFTIIADMAEEIGGDNVEVDNLVPTGTDPHDYEPLPKDTKLATDADILFYNGLNLEGGDNGWFAKLIDSVGQPEENVFSLTEQVEPMYLSGEDGKDEEVNPHSFIDPAVGIMMAEDMRDAFMEVDPDNEDAYQESADEYIDRLEEMDKEYEEKINDISEENRTLVTSERAFQYMADHYGLDELFIWAIDTEENGSPEQIKTLVTELKEKEVPVLFVESNVDTRPMETVSAEADIPIYEKPIYSDEIGEAGEEVDTYMKYLKYNIEVIDAGLSD